MEFETNTAGDKSPDISDETRLEASTRQATIEPLHDDVAAEDQSEEMTANQHILEGPIANSPTESEATTGAQGTLIHKEAGHPGLLVAVLILIAAGAAAMVLIIH